MVLRSGIRDIGASAPDEACLIGRIRAGEIEYFAELIEPYQHMLRRVCCSILNNRADAEEVVQEALLKAFSKLGQLHDGECFKSWLLQIAGNEARMLRRKRMGLPEEATEEADDALKPDDFPDWRENPHQVLERKELASALSRAVFSLDHIYGEVFILRDVQHLSVCQTAKILGITEAAATSRLHRARLRIRACLTPIYRREKLH